VTLESWTRAVLRARALVLAAWLVVLIAGILAGMRLPSLLVNSLAVPGTDSAIVQKVLARDFDQRREGTFTVVFQTGDSSGAALEELHRRLAVAARSIPGAHAGPVHGEEGIAYGEVQTALDLQQAKGWTGTLRRALRPLPAPAQGTRPLHRVNGTSVTGRTPGAARQAAASAAAYVTGEPALQHDLDPILSADLHRGELIAIPVALLLLVLLLGVSAAVLVPFLFAACTVAATLAALYPIAHHFSISSFAPNLVQLIGLGLAIDYSLLIVSRFREELTVDGRSVEEAIVRTMRTAGRSVAFSGLAVAIGLAVVLFMPVPFTRSLGLAGFLVPIFSIAAALTLQPVLLSVLGRRGVRRLELPHRWRGRRESGRQEDGCRRSPAAKNDAPKADVWGALTRAVMRRPVLVLIAGTAVLLAAAAPVSQLSLTPGSISAIPQSTESAKGLSLLRSRFGPGALTPVEIVIDTGAAGRARTRAMRAAAERLVDQVAAQREVYVTATGNGRTYVDRSARFRRITAIGRHEYGAEPMQSLVRQLRADAIPASHLPARVNAYVGGAPAQGVDFLDRVYGAFPWIVLAVLLITYLVLLRAFRSLLLPLKAVVLNVLSVLATYGLLVVIFQFGVGADLLGLYRIEQVEGWIPVFLFAMLFGLSMDYEVFLVTRMREAWEEYGDNERAVAEGLRRTGRIVSAAALIMVAAFSGFVAGRVAGLQEFGAGLAVAILLDVTVVRMLLVPSLMALFGSWNWWLPGPVARLARMKPSPRAPQS
jgi:RND superfamily putative drug exporter